MHRYGVNKTYTCSFTLTFLLFFTVIFSQITFSYLKGRPMAPKGPQWDLALGYWRTLPSDPGAKYDKVRKAYVLEQDYISEGGGMVSTARYVLSFLHLLLTPN